MHDKAKDVHNSRSPQRITLLQAVFLSMIDFINVEMVNCVGFDLAIHQKSLVCVSKLSGLKTLYVFVTDCYAAAKYQAKFMFSTSLQTLLKPKSVSKTAF